MWTGHGLLLFGGRSPSRLATAELWHFDWDSRCWRHIETGVTPFVPTSQAAAILLPNGFNSTEFATDGRALLAVAAQSTIGTGLSVGIYTRAVHRLVLPADNCAASDPASLLGQYFTEHEVRRRAFGLRDHLSQPP